jgi:hypothetical protein
VADIDLFSGSATTERKHGPRLTSRTLREDKRPAPRPRPAYDLFGEDTSYARALRLFYQIREREGLEGAQRIFRGIARLTREHLSGKRRKSRRKAQKKLPLEIQWELWKSENPGKRKATFAKQFPFKELGMRAVEPSSLIRRLNRRLAKIKPT